MNKEHRTACAFITKGNAAFCRGEKACQITILSNCLMIPTFASLLKYIRVPFWGLSSLHVCHQRGQARGHPSCGSPAGDRTGELREHRSLHILPPSKSPHLPPLLSAADKTCRVCRRLPSFTRRFPTPPTSLPGEEFGEGERSVPPAAGLFCKACCDAFRELHVVTLSQDFT